MKRMIGVIGMILLIFLLFSCGEGEPENVPTVFCERSRAAVSGITDPSESFPAGHGGKQLGQVWLGDILIQEEILVDGYRAEKYWCNVMDQEGSTLFSVDPAADLGYDVSMDNLQAGDVFRLTDEVLTDDALILATPSGLCAYSREGILLWTSSARIPQDLVSVGDGVYLLYQSGGDQKVGVLNPADGTVSVSYTPDDEMVRFESVGSIDPMLVGEDGNLYAVNDHGLYRLIPDEKENTVEICLIAQWSASYIMPEMIRSLEITDETSFAILQADPSSEDVQRITYGRITEEELANVQEITLAVFNNTFTDYHLPVFNYNQDPEHHKITLRDYSVYEKDQQVLRFNTDMAAGDAPDMVVMCQNDNMDSTIAAYERSGIFADLTEIFREKEDFRADDLLAYVTKPYQRNGKQYLFPLTPSASCYFGRENLFTGPVTVDEYLDICEEHQARSLGDRGLFPASVDDHVNEETGKCSFNDGTLARQMTRAASMAENPNEQPLKWVSLNYPTLLYYREEMLSMEGQWIPVGTPNASRELCTDITMGEYFAVLETSEHRETAVDFLQTLMERNKPHPAFFVDGNSMLSGCLGYTFYQSDIDEQLAFFRDWTVVIDGTFLFLYDDEDPALAKAEGLRVKLTEEDADALTHFLNSVTRGINTTTPVQRIFWDEYRSMKDQPTETMLDYVQSKASIYLAETGD